MIFGTDITFCINYSCMKREECFRALENYKEEEHAGVCLSYANFNCDLKELIKINHNYVLKEVKMGLYRHFKGNEYEVFDLAEHTETGETLVIYRSVNRERYVDNGIVYARPYDMFFGEVDKEKYPNVKQKDRFEYIGE